MIGNYHPPPPMAPPASIVLNYQEFSFNSTHKTIAWRLINTQNSNCVPPVTFYIQSSTCAINIPPPWTTPDTQYSLLSTAFVDDTNELLYFSITAVNIHKVECARTATKFQLSPNRKCCLISFNWMLQLFPNNNNIVLTTEQSIALGTNGCLDVPSLLPMKPVYAVWPGDNSNDCTCPLCDDGNCMLNGCQCYSTSTFKPILNVGTTDNVQLCWPNVDVDRNNSNIILFSEARVCDSDNFTTTPIITKTFVKAQKYVVRGRCCNLQTEKSLITHFYHHC